MVRYSIGQTVCQQLQTEHYGVYIHSDEGCDKPKLVDLCYIIISNKTTRQQSTSLSSV